MVRPSLLIRLFSYFIFKEKGARRNNFGSLITQSQVDHERSINIENHLNELLELICPWPSKSNLVRIGSQADGGYVLNEEDRDHTTHLFSGGIENNNDFEMELAELGVSGLQVDNSIDEAPRKHERLRFIKATVGIELGDFSVKSFLASQNEQRLLVKLDVEGAEWDTLDELSIYELSSITCLVAEFHFLGKLNQSDFLERVMRVFSKIRAAGLYPCFISPNNVTGVDIHGGVAIPRNLEITFTKKENINFEPTIDDWKSLSQMIVKNRSIYSRINIDQILFYNLLH